MTSNAGGGVAGGLDRQLWGTPNAGDASSWNASWTEIWDMDGFHPETGGWDNYLTMLKHWYQGSSSRKFRLCHSSGRVPPDPKTDSNPIWRPLLKEGLIVDQMVPKSGRYGAAYELRGQRWSAVRFYDSYIEGGAQGLNPELYGKDAHHATCVVAFSHARALTSL